MDWIVLVTLAALLQYLYFGVLVGRARGKYGIKAPATTGDDMFERYYRVQMNTIEQLIVFIPALWLAAAYWPPVWVSVSGVVYIVGRFVYLQAYTNPPSRRTLGYALSYIPIAALLIAALVGVLISLVNGGGD
jgi:glutathione S-transferase